MPPVKRRAEGRALRRIIAINPCDLIEAHTVVISQIRSVPGGCLAAVADFNL